MEHMLTNGRTHRGTLSQYLCELNQREVAGQDMASIRAIVQACQEDCDRSMSEPCPFGKTSQCLRIKVASLRAVRDYDTRN